MLHILGARCRVATSRGAQSSPQCQNFEFSVILIHRTVSGSPVDSVLHSSTIDHHGQD
jgi:hypothetical protein